MRAYGALELTESSPPQSFTEPLSLDEVCDFLRIVRSSPADVAQEETLSGFISAAREVAEILQNRDLIVKQYDLNLDILLGYDAFAGAAYPLRFNSLYNFGIGYEIPLRLPLRSVDLFQYTDFQGDVTVLTEALSGPASGDYLVDTRRGIVLPPWGKVWPFFTPQPSSAVLLRFTSGYASTHPFWQNAGPRLKVGMKMLIAAWHEGRLPFEPGAPVNEYPYTVTSLLSFGANPRVH